MTIYCVQQGDCIECGTGLVSIHATLDGAKETALRIIAELESYWTGAEDEADWMYVTQTPEGKERLRWKTRKGHDIVVVTEEMVNEV